MSLTLEESIARRVHGNWLAWLASQQTFWVSVAAVVAFVVLAFASDVFATQQNLFNVTRNFAFVAIIAIGMTAVIISGGIDLSVGAVLVLSGMVIGMTMNDGMSIWLAMPLALGASLLVGAFNGVLIAYVGVPSVRRHAGHAVDRAQPGDGAVGQPHGLRVRARPAAAAGARRRLRRPAAAASSTRSASRTRCSSCSCCWSSPAFAFRWTRWGRHLFAIGGNEARGDADRRAGQGDQGQRLHVLQPHAPASPASSRSAGSARSRPASGRAWS